MRDAHRAVARIDEHPWIINCREQIFFKKVVLDLQSSNLFVELLYLPILGGSVGIRLILKDTMYLSKQLLALLAHLNRVYLVSSGYHSNRFMRLYRLQRRLSLALTADISSLPHSSLLSQTGALNHPITPVQKMGSTSDINCSLRSSVREPALHCRPDCLHLRRATSRASFV